jgi:hypothetical protein
MEKMRKLIFVALCLFSLPTLIFAQGVTTASMSGSVTDSKGVPLAGANVVALHMSSGTVFGAATRSVG